MYFYACILEKEVTYKIEGDTPILAPISALRAGWIAS